VVVVGANQARGIVRLVDDRHLRLLGKHLIKPPREATGHEVAENQDLSRVRRLLDDLDGRNWRFSRALAHGRALGLARHGLQAGLRRRPPRLQDARSEQHLEQAATAWRRWWRRV